MMSGRRLGAVVLGVALVASGALAVGLRGGQEQQVFPHQQHERLFPFCTGCHQGVPDGDRAAFYPEPDLCSRCHNGERLDSVRWQPPTADEPEPIRFEHPRHIAAVDAAGDPALECQSCHVAEGGTAMEVTQELVLQQCLSCHGHAAQEHLVDAPCQTCHGPAAETPMGGAWLASLPYPPDHVSGEFLPELHGELAGSNPARCATCHVQERCTSCHVNADAVPAIATIPPASEGLELPRFSAHYFIPPSHEAPGFLDDHGGIASVESCSTCHTQTDCAACHTGERPAVVAALPEAGTVRAPGVLLEARAPSSHTRASFALDHGALASADPSSCTSCHTHETCSDCHEAAAVQIQLPQELAGPRFHPDNFMARHASEAYGRRLECSSCHNTAAFCRDCHQEAGFGSEDRLGAGFHDAEPNWLLRHGQPARQALESCATCHQQTDCLQCHSAVGSFRVSPHGADFDPRRAQEKNPAICYACHIEDPIG